MCSRRRAIKWKARPTRLTTTLFSSRYRQMMFPTRQLCFRLGSIFFINMNNRQLSGVRQGHLFKRWSSGRGSNPTLAPGHQQGRTCTSGLYKLWYPSIRDTSTWSKFGAHGEHGDVFLFSNLGALWFSENLIRYSLHVCLREVKNNHFSFKHSYLRHFSWQF